MTKSYFIAIATGLFLIGCGSSSEEATPSEANTENYTPTSGYIKTASTLTINDSNITWQDTESVYTSNDFGSWQEAVQYCTDLELENFTDWRLPTLSEYQDVLYPNKDALTFKWEDYYDQYGTYIFWTSVRVEVSGEHYIRMHNITNNLSPNFKESAITSDWSTRCVRDTN